jgi:outer membrane receptor protein involved in Fe transport
MKRIHGLLSLLVVLAAACCGTIAMAQITSARLTGEITDATGALVPHVKVAAKNNGTNFTQTTQSSDSGVYTFTALPPGVYTLTTELAGFAPHIEKGVTLTVGQSATLNIALKTGDASDTVTVTGGAELINTTTAEISNTVAEDEVKELPLNGRDPSSLVYLSAGVTNEIISQAASTQTQQSFGTQTGASAGGGRQGSTWYLLDGVMNMDTTTLLAAPFPNADSTQEFKVITNNFDARYGFAPSAVVSIQTKSGTNQIHGGAFEFVRNDAVNAKNYFSHAVDPLKRNQFGGYVGAPLIHDKLFGFANYQATRATEATTSNTANTPTTAMLQGDFSAVVDSNGNSIPLTGPFQTINGKPNQVDPALFSKGAVALEASIPQNGSPGSGLIHFANPVQHPNYDEGTGRLDYILNDKQRMFVRVFIDALSQPGASAPGNILSGVEGQHGIDLNGAVNHTWTISPALLNSVTAAYISYDLDSGTTVLNSSGKPLCLSQFINVADPPGQCVVNLSVSNGNALYGGASGFSVFSGSPYQTNRRDWILTDTVTKVAGKHTTAFGADVLHRHYFYDYSGSAYASIGFNGSYTGNIFADFLLGESTGVSQGSGSVGATNGWMLGLYAQDQYKWRPNVTLNYGIRWDPNFSPSIVGNRGAAFVPGAQSTRFPNAPQGLLFAGEQGVPSGLFKSSYGYFQPRLGVAWQVDPTLAVRAGFGLFTTPLEDAFYSQAWNAPPFDPSYSTVYSPAIPAPFDNPWSVYAPTGGKSPFPPFVTAGYSPPANTTFPAQVGLPAVFNRDFKLGITESWNASIEQQFGKTLAMHIVYVGSESYHQATTVEQNPGHFFGIGNPNNGARTTYPNFAGVLQVNDGATATYNALQVGFEKRFSHGYRVQSNFTWSHTFDVGGSGDPTFESSVADPYNFHLDHGNSSLNYPVVSFTNFEYESPKLEGKNPIVRGILGDWELTGILTLQSGAPFTMNGGNGNNNSFFNVGQDRADKVPGQPVGVRTGGKSHWINEYFNVNAFTQNQFGQPGNVQKYSIQEAPIINLDAGMYKNWTFAERYKVQFRWEAFNAMNNPSFGQPDSNPGDSNFGQVTGQAGALTPARVMQAGLKVAF